MADITRAQQILEKELGPVEAADRIAGLEEALLAVQVSKNEIKLLLEKALRR